MTTTPHRVGIVLCRCHGKADKNIDLDEVVHQAAHMRHVSHVEVTDCLCSPEGEGVIRRAAELGELDSVVIGSCATKVDIAHLEEGIGLPIRVADIVNGVRLRTDEVVARLQLAVQGKSFMVLRA